LEEYLEINFAKTFVTPYDPRISIRLFDFGDYKRHVMSLFKRDREMAIRYIQENSTQYRKERQIFRVMELKLVEVERNSL
jgi:hypothetical protein